MVKKILAIGVAVIMGMSVNISAQTQQSVLRGSTAQIIFKDDTNPQAVKTFVEENDISIDSFTVEVNSKGKEYTSGYIINVQDDFDLLWGDFVDLQSKLLNEAIANSSSDSVKDDLIATLNAIKSEELKMKNITCDAGEIKARNVLVNDYIVKEVVDINKVTNVESSKSMQTIEPRATNWIPKSGSASAWKSQNVTDATYMEVNYRWDSASQLSTLTNKPDSTLEADLIFYNYDGTAISDKWYGNNYTFSTNQPRAYEDTKAFDGGNEQVFSIGCSSAEELRANVDYYWIAYGNQTGSDSCKAKLNFQRGHRVVDSIYEQTWNIFGDETIIEIPFSSWTTGRTKYFTN